jgi:hypothetical protein
MKDSEALSQDAIDVIEDLDDSGMGARTEHFSGAELAGLVRSAASYALARVESDGNGMVTAADLEKALGEVRPALGTQVTTMINALLTKTADPAEHFALCSGRHTEASLSLWDQRILSINQTHHTRSQPIHRSGRLKLTAIAFITFSWWRCRSGLDCSRV